MPILRLFIKLLPLIVVIAVSLFIWRSCKEMLPGWNDHKQPEVVVTHHTILTTIEELGKMELVRYNFKDVVEYEKEVSRWIPNSKIALIVAGEAVGCIDFTKLRTQDIRFDGDSLIQIALPAPEICYYKVDHSKSKVFSKENTYFQDADLVQDSYRYAEENVKTAALNSGILRQTQVNAERILKPMLEEITGRKVVLVQQHTMQNPTMPPKR